MTLTLCEVVYSDYDRLKFLGEKTQLYTVKRLIFGRDLSVLIWLGAKNRQIK